ncbi:hypothetical protein H2248_008308 [Termitomyces sp. 'cryptogamus']|nr:hypothetical protein H2248_008308 [Termitomyces sp. 'cryptogamus']
MCCPLTVPVRMGWISHEFMKSAVDAKAFDIDLRALMTGVVKVGSMALLLCVYDNYRKLAQLEPECDYYYVERPGMTFQASSLKD